MLKVNPTTPHNYLIRQLPTATIFVNQKFEVVHASDKWIADFELDSSTVFGKPINELLTSISSEWETTLSNCLSRGAGGKLVHMNLDSRFGAKWYELKCVPWYDEQEDIIGLIITAEDITQRKIEEKQTRKLQSLLKVTCEIGKLGYWEYCFLEDKLLWCDMTRQIHEVSNDFVPTIDKAVQFYKDGHSRNTISMLIHRAANKSDHWSERLQIITAKGNQLWIQASGKPIYNDGKLIGLTGTLQNIDDQVKSEMDTKNREQLLRTLIDNLPVNVFLKDTESRKILVNKSECAYLGLDNPKDVLGKSDFDLYDHDIAQIYRTEDLKVMDTLTPMLAKETTSRKKNGDMTTFLTSKIPILNNEGKVSGLVGISLDISDIKQKEKELVDLVNITSLQNKKLINFAHIVSHNLRSHAANFSMLLDFLMEEKDDSEKKKILDMLIDASDHLIVSLENLNEVVDININVNLDKKPIPLKNKIDSVSKNLSAYLKNNNTSIINQVCDTVEIRVIPAYVDSILMNLVTNAVKYQDPKRNAVVTLNAMSENGYTVLSVTDNGLGIDLNKYGDKIFGMYKTFHNHCDARGMGLYIIKNQIEAMNGKIGVESQVGIGSTFKIYFNEKNQ